MKRRDVLAGGLVGAAGLGVSAMTQGGTASAAEQRDTTRVTKGYVPGPFGQIHYYEIGQGPALIMSHQSPVCARMFERAMPYLGAMGVRAIAVDTPGYGNSDVPEAPPMIPEYADAFVAFADGLGLSKAHYLGHHTGAGILCNFAARYPDRVDSLILHGPPLFSPEELAEFQKRELAPSPIHKDGSHLQARWDRRAKYSPGWTDEVAMHRRLVDQMWAGDTGWYGHNAAFHYEMKPDLMALTGRVLILTNTGEDAYDDAKEAHALRADLDYLELEGGTHDIVDEQPEAWSKAVADFVLAKG